jgi:hypothetical protein
MDIFLVLTGFFAGVALLPALGKDHSPNWSLILRYRKSWSKAFKLYLGSIIFFVG